MDWTLFPCILFSCLGDYYILVPMWLRRMTDRSTQQRFYLCFFGRLRLAIYLADGTVPSDELLPWWQEARRSYNKRLWSRQMEIFVKNHTRPITVYKVTTRLIISDWTLSLSQSVKKSFWGLQIHSNTSSNGFFSSYCY